MFDQSQIQEFKEVSSKNTQKIIVRQLWRDSLLTVKCRSYNRIIFVTIIAVND